MGRNYTSITIQGIQGIQGMQGIQGFQAQLATRKCKYALLDQ